MEVLFFMKNGSARGINYSKIRGAREYHSWTTPLETWIILAKNVGHLILILFSSSRIDCLNPIFIFWPLPYGNYRKSTSIVKHL